MLLAYDLWLIGLSHAPRYGAGGFNVAHLDFLSMSLPTPIPDTIGALYLSAGAISIWVAVGLVGRWGVFCCAFLYSLAYFWSQADSYQHHYLLCLCLFLFLGEPWSRQHIVSDKALRDTTGETRSKSIITVMCRGTALDALMFQMALIYGWTALAKCEPVWLSGETLSKIVSNIQVRQTIESVGAWFGLSSLETFAWSAWGVMIGEWFAAFAFIIRPLRSFAFFVIPWFHVMVEWIGFDIELFSYYMILLNIALLSPPVFWRSLDRLLMKHEMNAPLDEGEAVQSVISQRPIFGFTLAVFVALYSSLIVWGIPLEGAGWGAVIAGICICLSVIERLRRPVGGLALCLGLLGSMGVHYALKNQVTTAEFRFDYYRMWGGDLKRRGELREALRIYRIANEAQAPDLPARFIAAGEIAIKLGERERGLEELSEGARRRFLQLENLSAELLDKNRSTDKLREFQSVARSAQSAQETLYRAYLRLRDPRAEEAKIALEATLSMIQQFR